jgi:hypothetical protein
MRHLKDYSGSGGIAKLLLELGLDEGRPEDHEMAKSLIVDIPEMTLCEILRAIGVEVIDPATETPVAGYREAWLAIQAAAFRKKHSAPQGGGTSS